MNGAPVSAPKVDLDDVLSALLWLYRRLPRDYGRVESVEQSINAVASQASNEFGDDIAKFMAERGASHTKKAGDLTDTGPTAVGAGDLVQHREFTEGVVYACARVVEMFDQPTIAENILSESGVDVSLGCEDDLAFVRKIDRYKDARPAANGASGLKGGAA